MEKRNKILFILPNILLLTGCVADARNWKFNFNLFNSDFIEDLFNFRIVQVSNNLYWGPASRNKVCTYEFYKDGELLWKNNEQLGYVNIDKETAKNTKFQVYAYDGDKLLAKTPVYKYKPVEVPSEADADIIYYPNPFGDESVFGYAQTKNDESASQIYDDAQYWIPSSVNCISFRDFSRWKVDINFEKRKTPINIYLSNCNIVGSFNYYKKNSVLFNFIVSGTNTICPGIAKDSSIASSGLKLPQVNFVGDGDLTIKGGEPGTYNSEHYSPGYAIEGKKLYNGLSNVCSLKLIGGNGFRGSEKIHGRGETAQFPLSERIFIRSAIKDGIAIKAGDGGSGALGPYGTGYDGGDTYSYKCLVDNLYWRYETFLNNSLGDGSPGAGGLGKYDYYNGKKGKLLDDLKPNDYLNSLFN